jgi:hypothetical protein
MDPIALVLDQYPVHVTPTSHTKARKLSIKLILVPKGRITRYQPLDCRIYGALKSKARAKFYIMITIECIPSMTKEAAAKLAQE